MMAEGFENQVTAERFKDLPRFDVEKLAMHLQNLLLKLVHISIIETSFVSSLN